jgi:hypothetical protein
MEFGDWRPRLVSCPENMDNCELKLGEVGKMGIDLRI